MMRPIFFIIPNIHNFFTSQNVFASLYIYMRVKTVENCCRFVLNGQRIAILLEGAI